MSGIFWLIFVFIMLQRITELFIAKRNERWMREKGAIERGREHYKWFIVVHILFFCSILMELFLRDNSSFTLNVYLFIVFLLLQVARVWCIASLGKYWNTKIIILPNSSLVRKGPYKYVKHPNYIIVGLELLVIPLMFGANFTAVLFPIFHILLMMIRIPLENQALAELEGE